jgi:hypothetical protein
LLLAAKPDILNMVLFLVPAFIGTRVLLSFLSLARMVFLEVLRILIEEVTSEALGI